MMLTQNFAKNTTYNELLGANAASEIIGNCSNFDSILKRMGNVLFNYNIHNEVGIALLHRHHNLTESEVMVQRVAFLENGAIALFTAKERVPTINCMLIPTVWRCLSNGDILPLEYTPSSNVKLSPNFRTNKQKAFSEIADILASIDSPLPIGLTLLHPGLLSASRNGLIIIERMDAARAATVSTLEAHDSNLSTVTTNWSYEGTSVQRCIPFKQCVARSPGHDTTPGHEFVDE